MNLDTLTDQVLTLPREYRPIRLSQNNTICSENASKASSCSVNLPKLPELTAEIFVNNDNDIISVDSNTTVHCYEFDDIARELDNGEQAIQYKKCISEF